MQLENGRAVYFSWRNLFSQTITSKVTFEELVLPVTLLTGLGEAYINQKGPTIHSCIYILFHASLILPWVHTLSMYLWHCVTCIVLVLDKTDLNPNLNLVLGQ